MNSSRRGIPIIYYILTALSFLGALLFFFVVFRQLILFFGSHVVSTTTILVSGFLCLALGSYIGGKVAGKSKNALMLFIAFQILPGILILFWPLSLEMVTSIFLRYNLALNPGPSGIEMMRFLFSFSVFFLPSICYAGSLPVVTRYFIRHVSHSGRYMSVTILSISLAVILTLLLSLFFVVPVFGFNSLSFLAAMISFLAAALAIYFLVSSRKKPSAIDIAVKTEQTKRTSLRFKKKKAVLETEGKLTRAMLKVFFYQGFTTAAMAFLSFRILLSYTLMQPLFVFTITLSLIFTGILAGAMMYQKIAEKPANKYMTLATLQIMLGFGSLLSYLFVNILATVLFSQPERQPSLSNVLIHHLVLSASLVFIPSVLTGLSLPLSGKLYPKRLQQVGSSFGWLGTLFFVSAATGIVFTLFILIPLLEVQVTFLLLAFLTLISGIYLIFRDSRLMRIFRLGYALTAVLIFFILVIAFHFLDLKRNRPGVKNEVEGSTSNIRSIAHPDGSKSVLLNGIYFYGSDPASHKAQQLAAYLPLMINQQIRSALVIGFGTGMTASKLEEKGTSAILITDMFPEAVRFSANAFADENNDILTNSHVSISLSDARSSLIQKTDKTDLITCGVNLLYQMPGNYTTAFYKTGFEKLTESGILCQILPTQGITLPAFQSVVKSCNAVFPAVSLWYVAPEYVLMVASKNEHKPGYCHLSVNFAGMNSDQSLSGIKISNIESLLSHLLMDDKQLRSFTRDIPENTDDRPQVGYHPMTIRNINYQVLPELIKKSGNIPGFLSLEKDCEVDTAGVFRRIRLFNQILLQQDDLSFGS